MKKFIHRVSQNKRVRRFAGWSLITLGVIGMVAPLMPGIWFFLIGGKLLDTENKLFNSFMAWRESDDKIGELMAAYKRFYGYQLPHYLQSLSDRRLDQGYFSNPWSLRLIALTLLILFAASVTVIAANIV